MWRLLLSTRDRTRYDRTFEPFRGVEVACWCILFGWLVVFYTSPAESWERTATGRQFLEWGGPEAHAIVMFIALLVVMMPRLQDHKQTPWTFAYTIVREGGAIALGVLLIELGGVFGYTSNGNPIILGIAWTLIGPGLLQLVDTVLWAGRGHP